MSGGDKAKVTRRALLGGTAALAPALALAQQQPAPPRRQQQPADTGPPIVVFVHGNGDSSALWINNIWRFEANGYRRNQLFAVDFSYPSARTEDARPRANRSSTEDQMKALAVSGIPIVDSHAVAPHVISGRKQGSIELDDPSRQFPWHLDE